MDNSLGEAHTSLAFCLGHFEWHWDAAEKEYLQAIALNPGYATAHQWYALQLSLLGRSDEAIAEMRKAESLDPLSLIISADMADVLFAARRYDESIQQSRKAIDMDPNFAIAHFELGQALAQKKVYNTAIAELQKASELSPVATQPASPFSPMRSPHPAGVMKHSSYCDPESQASCERMAVAMGVSRS